MSTRGFRWDEANGRLSIYVSATEVKRLTSTTQQFLGTDAKTFDNGLIVTAGGMTVTAGNLVVTAGDERITAGNYRLGAISAFGTTEPTSALVMKVGTNPVGAIATSGAVFTTTGGATISKIIANGTVTQIEV